MANQLTRRWPRMVLALAALAAVVSIAAVAGVTGALQTRSAGIVVRASSTASGFDAARLAVASGDHVVWRSSGPIVGTTVQTRWSRAVSISRLMLKGDGGDDQIRAADLAFSDGSMLRVNVPASGAIEVPFRKRMVTSVTLTVQQASRGAKAVQLSQLRYDDRGSLGSAAGAAVTATSTGSGSASALLRTSPATSNVWSAAPYDPKPSLTLRWVVPVELVAVALHGSATGAGAMRSGALQFASGDRIPIAAVPAAAAAPTVVAFMPRSVTTLTLVSNDAGIALRGIEVQVAGGAPLVAPGRGSGSSAPVPAAVCSADDAPSVTSTATRPAIACPAVGSAVSGTFSITVVASPGTALTAEAWVPEVGRPGLGKVEQVARTVADDAGRSVMRVDGSRLSAGPLNVRITQSRGGAVVWAQVFNAAGVPLRVASSMPTGMTKTWADEFETPLSVSATGAGTSWTATKPSSTGPSEFGEGVFADPVADPDSMVTIDGDLRLRTSPLPLGRNDPFGWNRTALGALISSASLGGGGYSSQYGYFEARVLGAPGLGTWPAFWMVSTPNIADGEADTAEVDAFEMYGHDTSGVCRSTHGYVAGKDENPMTRCEALPDDGDWAFTWHIYGVRVLPDRIDFSTDGEVVSTFDRGPSADQPLYVMLDLELGGNWPVDLSGTAGTADMYVDWVRSYS